MRKHGFTAVLLALLLAGHVPAAGQEVGLKGGVVFSEFDADGTTYFDERLTATSLGVHARFRFGPIGLQPEFHVVTRGGVSGSAEEHESIRLEYMEIPLLLALPATIHAFEVFAVGGPFLALETRCRHVFEQNGLKTTVGCTPGGEIFNRNTFDWGYIVGAGVSRSIGAGRVMIEARHTSGLRDIHDGPIDMELRNRTFSLMLGYIVSWGPDPDGQ